CSYTQRQTLKKSHKKKRNKIKDNLRNRLFFYKKEKQDKSTEIKSRTTYKKKKKIDDKHTTHRD
ncbi:MAG: hypothetical protein V2I33_24390, partial [Kangiellaceae bacterium]|nr:hypothetical protein [Kangiellaceae bacterium]